MFHVDLQFNAKSWLSRCFMNVVGFIQNYIGRCVANVVGSVMGLVSITPLSIFYPVLVEELLRCYRQLGEMENALRHAGGLYSDDDINRLAQRQFDKMQVDGLTRLLLVFLVVSILKVVDICLGYT